MGDRLREKEPRYFWGAPFECIQSFARGAEAVKGRAANTGTSAVISAECLI